MIVDKDEAVYQAYKNRTVFDYLVRIKAFVEINFVCVCVVCGEVCEDADEGLNHLRIHRPKWFNTNSSAARIKYLVKSKGAGT